MRAHKTYHPISALLLWNFPQITADYGNQFLLPRCRRIYVNLYVPSRLTWLQHGSRLSLTQRTSIARAHTEFELKATATRPLTCVCGFPPGQAQNSPVHQRQTLRHDLTPGISPASLVPGKTAIASRWSRFLLRCRRSIRSTPSWCSETRLLALFAIAPPAAAVPRASLLSARQLSAAHSTGKPRQTLVSWLQALPGDRRGAYRLYHEVID